MITRILFVCTGNTCRSALAEHLFRKMLADERRPAPEIRSAGVAASPGMLSPREVLRVLERHGIEGTRPRARLLSGELVDWADLILAMEAGHQMAVGIRFPRAVGKVRVLKSYVGGEGPRDIADPIGSSQEVYDACAREIRGALEKLLEKLKKDEKE